MANGKTKAFYLPAELVKWLENQAEQEGRSESNFLTYIIRDYIARQKSRK